MSASTTLNANASRLSADLFSEAQAAVRTFATSEAIDAAASAAFGSGVSGATLTSTIFAFDGAGWPALVLVDDEALGGARGAYDRASDTIFLARDFAAHSAHGSVISVIVEEVGHAIDARVNASDAPGDEGEIFAQFVMGNAPDASELAALQAQNDHGTIGVDGNAVAVEFASTANGAKVGIVYSETSAALYWGAMGYSQLMMAAQSQAAMAGMPYDILTEADLKNAATLQQYDALIFPNFRHVKSADLAAIESALTQASQAGVSLIAAGDFMTNNESGADFANAYSRMSSLFGLQPQAYGSGNIAVRAGDTTHPMMSDYSSNELIHSYTNGFYAAYTGAGGVTPTQLVKQTIGSNTYNAVLATTIGGTRNVHFSTDSVLADNNLLWQAVDYAVSGGNGVSAGLQLSRNSSIVASRVDMDQAMYPSDVSPGDRPGIYDVLLPILQQWKTSYNFVGSYYVDIGNNPSNGEETNWTVSGEYYRQLLAMGNELGSHSVSHPHNTDALTLAQIQAEFQVSKQIIEQQMSQILGQPFTVDGAAVPGAPENLATALAIIQYYNYLSGGFSSVGAGYPGAFGYLTPGMEAGDKVYLAPNVSFDFSLIEFPPPGLTPEQASAKWQQEWNKLIGHADVPVLVWPWHDYGATAWSYDGETPSEYTTEMFTQFIQRAHAAGAEFVTLADLANRISSFDDSAVSWSVAGNTVTATVTSSDAGRFALDLDNLGSHRIQSVTNWYAYDDDSVFLDRDGGTFAVQIGATATDVTRIVSLPMRADLISLSGNGTDLNFSIVGQGTLVIDLVHAPARHPVVTGAGVVDLTGDTLVIDLASIGQHNVSVSLKRAPVTTSDFNGDGVSDLLWRNANDGRFAIWQMNGMQANSQPIGGAAPSWKLVDAYGDYSGDGKSDILLRNSDGTVVMWQMNGAQLVGHIIGAPALTWSLISGHGDYNGDGISEILWRNSDGTVATWQINGTQVTGVEVGIRVSSWSINDTHGDYNGDGKSDVLWRHTDGTVSIWMMNGTLFEDRLVGGAGPSWRLISGHSDYNGDGRSDILWRDSDGTVATWLLNGAQVTSQAIGSRPLVWSIVDAYGDYDGNGKSDILWRHSDGTVSVWLMNGAEVDAHLVGGAAPTWTIIDGRADYNGDGRSDILWRDSDGTVAVWQMNGAQVNGEVIGTGLLSPDWAIMRQQGATVEGNSSANILIGTVGNDRLSGKGGNDSLTGGAGTDWFLFDTTPNSATNKDTVTDFKPASDKLLLSEVLFGGPPRGQLGSQYFVVGPNAAAMDTNDFILYDTVTGNVSYDADGSGVQTATVFAILVNQPLLSAADVQIGLI